MTQGYSKCAHLNCAALVACSVVKIFTAHVEPKLEQYACTCSSHVAQCSACLHCCWLLSVFSQGAHAGLESVSPRLASTAWLRKAADLNRFAPQRLALEQLGSCDAVIRGMKSCFKACHRCCVALLPKYASETGLSVFLQTAEACCSSDVARNGSSVAQGMSVVLAPPGIAFASAPELQDAVVTGSQKAVCDQIVVTAGLLVHGRLASSACSCVRRDLDPFEALVCSLLFCETLCTIAGHVPHCSLLDRRCSAVQWYTV